ncbi:uncharacterized protein LOC141772537 [Sebastes fasciatus]|uniref:uncharacterized protein LOC141772537 n=1 Tax=Sebastes fasciatus TaxID=394691 RepID=UPI003D9DC29E
MGKLTVTAGLCLVIASLVSVSTASTAHSPKLVCHFNLDAKNRAHYGRFTVSDINPNLCTHLIFGSADINNLKHLAYNHQNEEEHYWSCNALKTRNTELKTMLEVGGSPFDNLKFTTMVATEANRKTFIESVIRLLRYYGFDGLNVDWRYPGSAYKDKFTLLCKELKEAFLAESKLTGRDSLIVTASVSAVKATIDESYEVAQIAAQLDFINVMTYDFAHSSGAVTFHHSGLYQASLHNGADIYLNAAFAMSYWSTQGAPKYKLNLGIAAFGKTYELSSAPSLGASVNGPGEAGPYTSKAGFLAYYEICQFLPGATIQFIPDQKVPYATKGDQWVGYDNQNSLAYKVKYIKDNGFGGAFLTSLDLDDFSGYFCKHGNYPFTSHLHSLLIPGFPNLCIGKANGLYSNSLDPSTYFNCWEGVGHIQKCPADLVFTQYSQSCEHPTTTSTENPCYGRLYGLYPHPHYPHCYYNCGHGIAHLQCCPANLVFKSSCQCCDYDTTTYNANTCFGKNNVLVPNPQDPYSYYKCITGYAHLLYCPSYSVFKTSLCVYPTPIANPCHGKPSGVYANHNDPYSFYHCDHGITYHKYCPTYSVFKQSCRCCAHPTTTHTGIPCNKLSNGLLPYPGDNHCFYHCSNGIAYKKRCPANLVFNPSCHCCDYPTSTPTVNPCIGVSNGYYAYTPDPHCFYKCASGNHHFLVCPKNYVYKHSSHCCVYGITGPTGNPCHNKAYGYFPFQYDPHYYYNCAHGIAYLQKCAANLVWDSSCTCCNYPPSTNTGFCYGKPSGHYAHPSDPHAFYQCDHGITHLKYCSDTLVWDSSCTCCNHPPATGPCSGKGNGLYYNPYGASYYYNCWNGHHYAQKCPGNLVFTQYLQSCGHPTTTPPANPCHGKAHGLYPNPHDPHCFYNCGHGIAHPQCCPANLVFKSSCQCCDYHTTTYNANPCSGKHNVLVPNPQDPYSYYKCIYTNAHLLYCPSYSIFKTSLCVDPTPIANPCHGKSNGFYANFHDASSYYYCDHGISHKKYCASGSVFKHTCHCCARPTTTPTGIPCNGLIHGLLPYPGDNHWFYHCSNGIAYKKQCPANLIFNPSSHVCDYPTSTPTGNPCNGVSNGYYPYQQHSRLFYHCVGGNHMMVSCPTTYYFKHSTHCCVYGP